jgi:hypothetical protein
VVVISDGVSDDCTNYENPTLCFIICSLIGRILETHFEWGMLKISSLGPQTAASSIHQ